MNVSIKHVSLAVLLSILYVPKSSAFQDGKVEETFQDVREVRIKTVSGDCIVERGDGDAVRMVLSYTFDDFDYEPEFEQRGNRLILTERFRGRGSVRGRSEWRLTVPENTNIDFSTASGTLEVSDLRSIIEASTASGDVTLRNVKGELKISTASGDVMARDFDGELDFGTASGDVHLTSCLGTLEVGTASGRIRANNLEGMINLEAASGDIDLSEASGEFELSAASGDVKAQEIFLTARSSFSTASGDVDVELGRSPEHDLKVSSASGRALLNFRGNRIRGFIEMTARVDRRSRIEAPFDFDDEDYYVEWDHEYVTKTVVMGSRDPKIEIRTASGKAVLLER